MTRKLTDQQLAKSFYTTGEMAELCHLSSTTIFRAITHNQLKAATTPGGHFRIPKEEVKEFLSKNRIEIAPGETKTKKILIVEDNPIEARLYHRALRGESNFVIEETGSGYKAGYLTQSFKPDLILLDIFLNDVDGREVAKLVRSTPALKYTKIVAITGIKDEKTIEEIKSWGFDAFIKKPISPGDLLQRIKEVLK